MKLTRLPKPQTFKKCLLDQVQLDCKQYVIEPEKSNHVILHPMETLLEKALEEMTLYTPTQSLTGDYDKTTHFS